MRRVPQDDRTILVMVWLYLRTRGKKQNIF
jgi:hypothetical protein